MSTEDNKAVARRLFDAMTRGDLGAVDALFTPNAVVHDPGRELRGRDAIRQGLGALRAAFPDVVYAVEDQLGEGDRIWPNPEYGWLTGVALFTPQTVFTAGGDRARMVMLVNPNARSAPTPAMEALFAGAQTFRDGAPAGPQRPTRNVG